MTQSLVKNFEWFAIVNNAHIFQFFIFQSHHNALDVLADSQTAHVLLEYLILGRKTPNHQIIFSVVRQHIGQASQNESVGAVIAWEFVVQSVQLLGNFQRVLRFDVHISFRVQCSISWQNEQQITKVPTEIFLRNGLGKFAVEAAPNADVNMLLILREQIIQKLRPPISKYNAIMVFDFAVKFKIVLITIEILHL